MDDIKRPIRNYTPAMDIRPTRPAPPPVRRSNYAPTPSRPPAAPATPATPPQPMVPKSVPPPAPKKFNPPAPFTSQPALTEMALPPKAKAPVAAIVTAIIVSLGLIGLTVFAFLKTQDRAATDNSGQAPAAETMTPEEVDTTQEAIDQEIGTTNDEQDFNSSDLSDTTLGL